jgi:phage tail sheath protein FI
MASYVSPGVFPREVDFSQYAARISQAIVGMVGFTRKGPVNKITDVGNESQLIGTFGEPLHSPEDNVGAGTPYNPYLIHAAIQFLRQGNQLKIVRAAAFGTGQTEATFTAKAQDATPTANLVLTATSMGTWANVESPAPSSGVSTRGITVVIANATLDSTNKFKLEVYYKGVRVEVWDELSHTSTDSRYVETIVNATLSGSRYIIADQQTGTKPTSGTIYFTGGQNADQETGAQESALIGTFNSTTGTRTGAYLFSDADAVDLNILCVPAAKRATALTVFSNVTNARGDCLQLVDPESKGLSPRSAVDFANGTGAYAGNSFNQNQEAFFWPWVEYYSPYYNEKVYTPPCGWVSAQIAYTDRVADPWFAPAGLQRGVLVGATDIEYSASLAEREFLYTAGQVVNPIVNFKPDGIVIWGQKTCQRTASALDRINVRRLLNYAKKVIASAVRVLVFEPHDPATWRQFKGIVQPELEAIKARRGLVDFRVICDATTNTPDRVDRNEMYGILLLKPTKAAETLTIDFTVLAQGASFAEGVGAGS